MANSITLFKRYIGLLDEVYKQSSLTSVLDGDTELMGAGANANELVIPKITMDGLADYSRNGGYVAGDVTLTNETVTFNYDRGRKFSIDAMDNEETAGVAFGKLSSEFIRTKTAPEIDAFRFACYASKAGVSSITGTYTTGEDVIDAIVQASAKMDDDEVPETDRYLFISQADYNKAMQVDITVNKDIFDSFAAVIRVPKSRFYTKIDLKDGTSDGETDGGFAPASDAKAIHFMIVHKPAVIQYPKHTVNKIVTPQENQVNDSWMFFFRSYGLADVMENKLAGIYVSYAA